MMTNSTCLSRNLVKTVACLLCFMPLMIYAAEDSCLTEIYSGQNMSLKLYDRTSCTYSIFDGNGFVILSEFDGNEITKLLWGEAYIDATDTYYTIVDLDDDNVNELLTVYSFCNSFWGYLHHFEVDSLDSVTINTIAIPDSISSKIDFSGVIETKNRSILIHAVKVDKDKYVMISYDEEADSFVFDLKD